MRIIERIGRRSTVALALCTSLSLSACASTGAGGLGNILGSVLGGGQQQASQVSGTIVGVDGRNAQIVIQQSNGQNVGLQYDANTKVVYQNQNYAVGNLESGDMVTARIQQLQNGGYYTDLVQVDQSRSSNTGSTGSGQLQQISGVVRQVDINNGLFTVDVGSGATLTVSMPYSASRTDVSRFQSLRSGNSVRFTGVYLNNSRVELRQFN